MDWLNTFISGYIEDPKTLTLQIVQFIFIYLIWRAFNKKTDQIIEAKEKEIQRLADDNRSYREIYLVECLGLPKKEMNKISAGKLKNISGKKEKGRDK